MASVAPVCSGSQDETADEHGSVLDEAVTSDGSVALVVWLDEAVD